MSQFGQPPLAAYLPLRAGQNLADIPDKAAALNNLGTLSSSDIMMNAVPIGTVISFYGPVAPVGYIPCNGQTINSGTFPDLVTFLGGTTSAVVPDLRGEFLRGWDNGRGVDIGRNIRSTQADDFKSHTHAQTYGATSVGGAVALFTTNVTTGTTSSFTQSVGGVETRPRNVAVLYCIKAYGALVNTTTANVGNVLTELSQCTKLTQFGSSLSAAGYQKLPSGLVVQWGSVNIPSGVTSQPVNITFPIAFPNNAFTAMATIGVFVVDYDAIPEYRACKQSVSVGYPTKFGVEMQAFVDNNTNSSRQIQWIAIGY